MDPESRFRWLEDWITYQRSTFSDYLAKEINDHNAYIQGQRRDAETLLREIRAENNNGIEWFQAMSFREWKKVWVCVLEKALLRPHQRPRRSVAAYIDKLKHNYRFARKVYEQRILELQPVLEQELDSKAAEIRDWFAAQKDDFEGWLAREKNRFQQWLTTHRYYREYLELRLSPRTIRRTHDIIGRSTPSSRPTAAERVIEYHKQDDRRREMMRPTITEQIRSSGPTIAEMIRPKPY